MVYTVYTKVYLPFYLLPSTRFISLYTYRRGHMHRLHMYADRDGTGAEGRENGKNNKEQQNWVRVCVCGVCCKRLRQ